MENPASWVQCSSQIPHPVKFPEPRTVFGQMPDPGNTPRDSNPTEFLSKYFAKATCDSACFRILNLKVMEKVFQS